MALAASSREAADMTAARVGAEEPVAADDVRMTPVCALLERLEGTLRLSRRLTRMLTTRVLGLEPEPESGDPPGETVTSRLRGLDAEATALLQDVQILDAQIGEFQPASPEPT